MKLIFNLINKLYKVKTLAVVSMNSNPFVFSVKNTLENLTMIDKTNARVCILKNNTIINNNKIFSLYDKFKLNVCNYLNLASELLTLIQYRDFLLKKVHSSFDLNMLYAISLMNDDTESIFDLDSNSTLNIRRPYRSSNPTLLRRTGLIDSVLKKYIETILEDKVSINFDKYNICFVKKKSIFLRILSRRMRRISRLLRNSDLPLRTFIRVTFIFMCTKDLDLFSKVLLKVMNSMHYKNHRRFLYYLKLFITKSMSFYFNVLKFEGFFFYLSGKISGGGNSKKKHYVVKHGKYSLTNKMLKLKFKKGLIHTKTGVMGYRFMVSYK